MNLCLQRKGDWMGKLTGVALGVLLGEAAFCGTVAAAEQAQGDLPLTPEQRREIGGTVGALQQMTPAAGPSPQKGEAAIVDENQAGAAPGAQVRFDIANFRLEAPELDLDKAALTKILQDGMGRERTLASLNATINEITMYARRHGYPAAAAYLPVQETSDGMITIRVIPGRIGAVKIDNQSRLRQDVAESFLHGLKKGEILRSNSLETALYSISDASGARAVGVLAPGADFGETELTVRLEDGKGDSTVVYAENYGSVSTGRYRYGVQHSMYNVEGTGAKFKIGGLVSNASMHNFYLNYEMLAGRGGTTIGLGYSRMDYELGGSFRDLHADGTADTVSLFGNVPLYHTSNRSLRFTYGYDYRNLVDRIYDGQTKWKKHSYVLHAGVEGMVRAPGLVTEYTANLSTGTLALDSDGARQLEMVNHTEGRFSKAEASVRVVQALGARTDATLFLSGQVASRNLDSSEDFSLGGASGVRAYPQGEGSGDTGYLASLEVRYYTPIPGLVASTYFDMGHVNFYRDPRSGSGGATLKGYGFGLAYTRPNDWFARLDYARRIGGYEDMSKGALAKGRMWFILGKLW